MQYQYNTDGDYPARMGVERWFSSEVDQETGVFEVPEDHERIDEIRERLEELGHEPVGEQKATDPLAGLTEDDIVRMEYRELQQIAGNLDDVKGNASEGEIEEALILKLRGSD